MFIGHVFDEWYVKGLQNSRLLRLCKRDCDYSNCSTKNRRVELGLLGWNLFQLLIQPNKKWLDRRGNVKDNVGPHYFHGFWVTPWGQVTFFIVPVYLLNIMIHSRYLHGISEPKTHAQALHKLKSILIYLHLSHLSMNLKGCPSTLHSSSLQHIATCVRIHARLDHLQYTLQNWALMRHRSALFFSTLMFEVVIGSARQVCFVLCGWHTKTAMTADLFLNFHLRPLLPGQFTAWADNGLLDGGWVHAT